MKKSLLLFALFIWVGVQTVMAQTKAKGRVVDDKGEGVPGAAIKVLGTTGGTMTDADGNFEMDVPNGASLVISSVGLGEKTIQASDNMNVTLSHDINNLIEVVVTNPYAPPVAKEKYVGAADVITSEQFKNRPITTLSSAIEGAAPGVQTTTTSGQPGSGGMGNLRIRGVGSLPGSSGTSPLLVVNGNVYDGDIASINPTDIESITILKDATSTSLYGSRGSNGVIVVTTKRGRRGEKSQITVDAKVGLSQRGMPTYDVMRDPKDYYEASWRALYNSLVYNATNPVSPQSAGKQASGITGSGVVDQMGYNSYHIPGVEGGLQNAYLLDSVTGKLNPNAALKYETDDWNKAMLRTGLRQDYNLSVSGGSDKTDFYLSAGYLKEKGILLNTDFQRFSTNLNVNTQVTDWLKTGMNISAALSTQNNPSESSGTSSANPSYIGQNMAPIFPVYYRDSSNNKVIDPYTGKYKYDYGSLTKDPDFSMGDRATNPGDNIVGQMQLNENKYNTTNIIFAPYLEAKFLKNFTARTTLTTNYTDTRNVDWGTSLHGQFHKTPTIPVEYGGALSKYTDNYFNYTWNQSLMWNKTFNSDHEVSASVVHENYYFHETYLTGGNTGFLNEDSREIALGTGTKSSSSNTYDERLESYLGLVNYTYKGRYIFNANVRRDGLSRFAPENRWGTFWAVGGAWILSDENFMKGVSWVQNLKLKVSYGTQGNSQILNTSGSQNYYAWQGLYDQSRPNGANPASIPVTLENRDLHWEAQKQLNFGTEFTLFNRILSGEINLYNRATSGLYYQVPTFPSGGGYASILRNAASMYNRGVELNFYVSPVTTKNFSWKFNTNFSKFVNKVTELAPGVDSAVGGNGLLKKGHSVYDYWMAHSSGVDKTNGDELYSYYTADGVLRDTSNYSAALTGGGRRFTGTSSIPAFQGAFTNTLRYKGFEFSFLISYSIGGQFYDGIYANLMSADNLGSNNFHNDVKNSWTPENPNATLPRLELGSVNIGQNSDRFLISSSWVSIKNINLSYTFPTNVIKPAGFSSLTAYLSCDNVAFKSARQGMNPQQSFGGSSDYLYVPARILTFGLRMGL